MRSKCATALAYAHWTLVMCSNDAYRYGNIINGISLEWMARAYMYESKSPIQHSFPRLPSAARAWSRHNVPCAIVRFNLPDDKYSEPWYATCSYFNRFVAILLLVNIQQQLIIVIISYAEEHCRHFLRYTGGVDAEIDASNEALRTIYWSKNDDYWNVVFSNLIAWNW